MKNPQKYEMKLSMEDRNETKYVVKQSYIIEKYIYFI
jgi:hypothetical protein